MTTVGRGLLAALAVWALTGAGCGAGAAPEAATATATGAAEQELGDQAKAVKLAECMG